MRGFGSFRWACICNEAVFERRMDIYSMNTDRDWKWKENYIQMQ